MFLCKRSHKLKNWLLLYCGNNHISIFNRPVRFGGFRDADKENHGPPIPQAQEDDSDEEDGHILYRDDDEPLEEEGKFYFNKGTSITVHIIIDPY